MSRMGQKRYCKVMMIIFVLLFMAGVTVYYRLPVDAVGDALANAKKVTLAYVNMTWKDGTQVRKTKQYEISVNSEEYEKIRDLLTDRNYQNCLKRIWKQDLMNNSGEYLLLHVGHHELILDQSGIISVDGVVYQICENEKIPLQQNILNTIK